MSNSAPPWTAARQASLSFTISHSWYAVIWDDSSSVSTPEWEQSHLARGLVPRDVHCRSCFHSDPSCFSSADSVTTPPSSYPPKFVGNRIIYCLFFCCPFFIPRLWFWVLSRRGNRWTWPNHHVYPKVLQVLFSHKHQHKAILHALQCISENFCKLVLTVAHLLVLTNYFISYNWKFFCYLQMGLKGKQAYTGMFICWRSSFVLLLKVFPLKDSRWAQRVENNSYIVNNIDLLSYRKEKVGKAAWGNFCGWTQKSADTHKGTFFRSFWCCYSKNKSNKDRQNLQYVKW